jgi:phosphoglycolate phosphatase
LTARPRACYKPAVERPRFDQYIFDLDGTLIDSAADIGRSVNACLGELGLTPLPIERIRTYIGEGVHRLMERALEGRWPDHLEEAISRFRAHYAAHLLDETRAYDGVPAVLEALHARGAHLAVCSNKPEAFSRAILRGLGLDRFLDLVLGGDSLPERKPSPSCVRHILGQSGARPERTLLVGDSRIDVETARNAGVAVCVVTYGLERPEVLAALHPDFLADRPEQILEATAP